MVKRLSKSGEITSEVAPTWRPIRFSLKEYRLPRGEYLGLAAGWVVGTPPLLIVFIWAMRWLLSRVRNSAGLRRLKIRLRLRLLRSNMERAFLENRPGQFFENFDRILTLLSQGDCGESGYPERVDEARQNLTPMHLRLVEHCHRGRFSREPCQPSEMRQNLEELHVLINKTSRRCSEPSAMLKGIR